MLDKPASKHIVVLYTPPPPETHCCSCCCVFSTGLYRHSAADIHLMTINAEHSGIEILFTSV